MIGVTRCCLAISRPWVCCHSRNQDPECFHKYPCKVPFSKSQQFAVVRHASSRGLQLYHLIGIKCPIHKLGFGPSSWKTFVMPANMEEEPSSISQKQYQDPNGEFFPEDNSIQILTQKFEADELKSLLADSERTRLTSKLSEANRHNRFLKRQLQIKEDALVDCKSELAALELELQTLIGLAEEMAQSHIPQGWRKINGKYVPSYLLSRLEAFQAKLKEQVKGVDAAKYEDVELLWFGMAEVKNPLLRGPGNDGNVQKLQRWLSTEPFLLIYPYFTWVHILVRTYFPSKKSIGLNTLKLCSQPRAHQMRGHLMEKPLVAWLDKFCHPKMGSDFHF